MITKFARLEFEVFTRPSKFERMKGGMKHFKREQLLFVLVLAACVLMVIYVRY